MLPQFCFNEVPTCAGMAKKSEGPQRKNRDSITPAQTGTWLVFRSSQNQIIRHYFLMHSLEQ